MGDEVLSNNYLLQQDAENVLLWQIYESTEWPQILIQDSMFAVNVEETTSHTGNPDAVVSGIS
jgi:hypothetical protein